MSMSSPGSHETPRWRETDSNHRSRIEGSSGSPQSRQPFQTGICGAVSQFGESVQKGLHVACFIVDIKPTPFAEFGRSRSTRRRSRQQGKFEDRGSRLIPGPKQSRVFVKRRFALHTRYRVGERDPGIHAAVENRAALFPGGSNRLHDSWRVWRRGCPGVGPIEPRTVRRTGAEERANLGSRRFCLAEGDTVDPNEKTIMVEGFVAAFARAARVSDVPEEAITSDTREPSYMFLAAEWNRSTVSERAYLLAMLFGREFEVEANDFSLQIADLAMMMGEADGSPALIARADLAAADDGGTRTGATD
jgi:hypothetical protein